MPLLFSRGGDKNNWTNTHNYGLLKNHYNEQYLLLLVDYNKDMDIVGERFIKRITTLRILNLEGKTEYPYKYLISYHVFVSAGHVSIFKE